MAYEPPVPDLRASDAEREGVVGRLRVAAMEGRLDADELAQRVSAAYAARWRSELDGLTADITPPASVPQQWGPPVFVAPTRRTNGLAIASVVLGLVWMWWIGSFAAIVLGHVALGQISRSAGRQTGRGLAVTGIGLGYFGLLVMLIALFHGL